MNKYITKVRLSVQGSGEAQTEPVREPGNRTFFEEMNAYFTGDLDAYGRAYDVLNEEMRNIIIQGINTTSPSVSRSMEWIDEWIDGLPF